MSVEIPPGDAVLGGDHRGVLLEQRCHQRPARRVGIRLEAEEHIVDRADVLGPVGGVHPCGEITARAEHPYSVLSHGREMRPAGDEMNVGTRPVEGGSDIGADRSGADDCDFHVGLSVRFEGDRGKGHTLLLAPRGAIYCLQYGVLADKASVRYAVGKLGRGSCPDLPNLGGRFLEFADDPTNRTCRLEPLAGAPRRSVGASVDRPGLRLERFQTLT